MEKPAFLCPCFWDPTRNSVRTTARAWVNEVTWNGRREAVKARETSIWPRRLCHPIGCEEFHPFRDLRFLKVVKLKDIEEIG